MAEYPVYTAQDIADFSGRPVSSYSDYADMACAQATLFFKMATCLAALPDDPDNFQMAEWAILSVADYLALIQPHQEASVGPFNSENIGSYSYSRRSQAMSFAIKAGQDTGIAWFDLAVDRLGVCDTEAGVPIGGGVELFEHDGIHVPGVQDGNDRVLGPKDIHREPVFGADPGAHLNGYTVPQNPLKSEDIEGHWEEDPANPGFAIWVEDN